jgi:hypothetical protein
MSFDVISDLTDVQAVAAALHPRLAATDAKVMLAHSARHARYLGEKQVPTHQHGRTAASRRPLGEDDHQARGMPSTAPSHTLTSGLRR